MIASQAERVRVAAGWRPPTEVRVAREAAVKAFGASCADFGEVRLDDSQGHCRGQGVHLEAVLIGAGHVALPADRVPRPPTAARYVDSVQLLGSWRIKSLE